MNCTVQTIANWETGFVVPPLRRLSELAVILQTDLFDFFEEVDDAA